MAAFTLNYDEAKTLFFELVPKLIEGISTVIEQNSKIEKKLEELGHKVDQTTVKEIQSSYQLISGLSRIASPAMKERHLINAETNLLKNIALNKDAKTADISNTVWIARSYYGLACIAALRDEKKDASRFLLEAYLADPKESRDALANEVYKRYFKPYCTDIYNENNRKKAEQPANDEKIRKIKRKLLWAKTGRVAGAAFSLFAQNPMQRMTAMRATEDSHKEIQNLEYELRRIPNAATVEYYFDLALDERCREIASKLLQSSNFSAY